MAENSYVQMLLEGLEKKADVLRQLQVLCLEQAQILQDETAEAEAFEKNVEEKAKRIQQLEMLDQGFEQVFARVEQELTEKKETYSKQIKAMQELIRDITERSANLQVQEKLNYDLAKNRFVSVRSQAKELRQSSKVVSSYYQSMMSPVATEPRFMDSKK